VGVQYCLQQICISCCGVLDKVIIHQVVNKLPTCYGNCGFITMFKRAPHRLYLSQMNPIHILTKLHYNIILPSTRSHLTFRIFNKSLVIISGYGLDDRAMEVRSPAETKGFFLYPLSRMSRLALGPTQPPVQWVPGVLSPGLKRGRGVTLTTHPHLVPSLRMSSSYNFLST
jgi:hypothetical protein